MKTKGGALFRKDFTLMVLGQIISLFGNSILRFSLSLYVLDQTGSAAVFGGILAVSMIPTVLFSPFGGLIADRVNRRNIMVALDFITAALIALLSVLIRSGSLVPVAAAMVLLSMIQAFYQPSVQASIPALAGDANLERANGTVIQVNALANLIGPVLGGFLYGFLGISTILAASGFCFFCSAVMELFLHIPFVRQKQHSGLMATVKNDFGDALRFLVRENPQFIRLLGVLAGLNLFISAMLMVGLPYIIRIFLGLSSQHYGFAEGALAVGSIMGGALSGIFAAKIPFQRSSRLLLLTVVGMLPIGLATFTNSAPLLSYGAVLLSILVSMCFASLFNIFAQSFLQRQTPAHMMGKVASVITTVCTCAYPLGQAIYGILFDRFPNALPVIIFFGCGAGFLIVLATSRIQKRMPVSPDSAAVPDC